MKTEFSILVAEDDEGHYTLIRRNLFRMGFRSRILRFEDGQEVLDFLFRRGEGPHRDPDMQYLLILDIRMPRIDGIEVLRQIRQDDELHDLPVVVLTTADDEQAREQCRCLGCNDYVIKPVDQVGFLGCIQRVSLAMLMSVVEMSNHGPHSSGRPGMPADTE